VHRHRSPPRRTWLIANIHALSHAQGSSSTSASPLQRPPPSLDDATIFFLGVRRRAPARPSSCPPRAPTRSARPALHALASVLTPRSSAAFATLRTPRPAHPSRSDANDAAVSSAATRSPAPHAGLLVQDPHALSSRTRSRSNADRRGRSSCFTSPHERLHLRATATAAAATSAAASPHHGPSTRL
jgi:hypothetical protein